jgi:hypothetical protein
MLASDMGASHPFSDAIRRFPPDMLYGLCANPSHPAAAYSGGVIGFGRPPPK